MKPVENGFRAESLPRVRLILGHEIGLIVFDIGLRDLANVLRFYVSLEINKSLYDVRDSARIKALIHKILFKIIQ
jgi:hypothetical protein